MNTRAAIESRSRHAPHWLVAAKLLDASLVEQALLSAEKQNQPLVKYLVDQAIVDSRALAWAASKTFKLPLLDLEAMDMAAMPVTSIDLELIRKHHVLPLRKHEQNLTLGISDPALESSISVIAFHTGCKIRLVVVEENKLNDAIQDLVDTSTGLAGAGLHGEIDFTTIEKDILDEASHSDSDPAESTPVMRFVNKILMDAIRSNVSDVHIECYENTARIRFREDGTLREVAHPPPLVTRKMVSRLKVMASMDIAEKRLPQDSRFKLKLSRSRAIDFRISTLPTLWGEKTVIRLLDPHNRQLDLAALGFSEEQRQLYQDALHCQQGLILVTGPTGSGKSRTLYAGLNMLNTRERNIATAEDPVEMYMQGINQVAINPTVGLDFTEALRAFLRQDPDVLMVGEIRDIKTAEIALRAAQTGHLVLSTLHTNSAAQTLYRLMDMGISPYQIATSASLVIAQRLARRLCNHCKNPVKLPKHILVQEGVPTDLLENAQFHTAAGCEKCQYGHRGRIGIYETVPITGDISRVIMTNGTVAELEATARRAGLVSLRTTALEKAARGLISLAEANRITGSIESLQ